MNQHATPHVQVHSAPASGDQEAARYGRCAAQPPNLAQLLRITYLAAHLPMGRSCRFPRSAAVIELRLRMLLSTLRSSWGAMHRLCGYCYQEKRRRRRDAWRLIVDLHEALISWGGDALSLLLRIAYHWCLCSVTRREPTCISGLMALEPGSFVHDRVGTYRNLTFENPSARLGIWTGLTDSTNSSRRGGDQTLDLIAELRSRWLCVIGILQSPSARIPIIPESWMRWRFGRRSKFVVCYCVVLR